MTFGVDEKAFYVSAFDEADNGPVPDDDGIADEALKVLRDAIGDPNEPKGEEK